MIIVGIIYRDWRYFSSEQTIRRDNGFPFSNNDRCSPHDTSGRSARRWEEWQSGVRGEGKKGKDRGGGKRWPGFLCLFAPEKTVSQGGPSFFVRGGFGTAVSPPSPPLHSEWSIDQPEVLSLYKNERSDVILMYTIFLNQDRFLSPYLVRHSTCNVEKEAIYSA